METKKLNAKQNVEFKEYSANQSVNVRNEPQKTTEQLSYNASKSAEVRKGYNPQMTTQARNEQPIREGYNAQQMVQTANNQQPAQQNQQTKTTKSSDDKK